MKDRCKEVKSMLDELSEEQFYQMVNNNKVYITPQEDFRDWMLNNFYVIEDFINGVILRNAINQGLYKAPDFNDEQIIEELVEGIKEGIFNVIDTYEGDK